MPESRLSRSLHLGRLAQMRGAVMKVGKMLSMGGQGVLPTTQLAEVLGHTDIGQIARGFVADHGRTTTVDMGPVVVRHTGLARRLVGG